MIKAWSSIEEVPLIVFQGHLSNFKVTRLKKSSNLTQIGRFRTLNSSLNTPMATKWCTKLEVALKKCPIVLQGHPSNLKVTRLKKSSNLTQIGRFRTLTQVRIPKDWNGNYHERACSITKLEVNSSFYDTTRPLPSVGLFSNVIIVKFQGHMALKIVEFDSNWAVSGL